jgi:hypothetical protein
MSISWWKRGQVNMAQAAVAGVAADAAAQAAGQVAEKAMQKTIEFLDQDVISWSKQKTTVKISPDGRRETEELTKWSAGVKVWELGIVLITVMIWEGLQILQGDLSQLTASASWVEQALSGTGSSAQNVAMQGAGPIFFYGTNSPAGSPPPSLPPMGSMTAMQVLDAQLGVFFAQVLGPLNLSGGSLINGIVAQLSKAGNQI